MKIALLLSLAMLATGCTTHNSKGDCVGVLDKKTDGVRYDLSYWNVFLAVIFSETIIVPAVVVTKQLECPRE